MSIRELFDIPIPIIREAYKKVLEKHDADCLVIENGNYFKKIFEWCEYCHTDGNKSYRIVALDLCFEMIDFVEEILNINEK